MSKRFWPATPMRTASMRSGRERPLEHPLVVGVGLLLGAPGGQRPAVDRGLDPLHGQVGALDDAHLDAGAAVGAPLGRPGLDLLHRGEAVGQVGLQDDAGLEVGEVVEDPGEHRDGEVEVAVLLHVEVDERTAGGGLLVQGPQPLDDAVDGLVEGPQRQLAGDGRHLDRDVVDVVALEQGHRAVAPAGGLALTQDRLAEEVEVEAVAATAKLLDGLAELLRPGVDDQVADEPTQRAPRLADDETGHEDREHRAELEQQTLPVGQELRGVAGEGAQVARGDAGVLRPHDAVDESDGEVEAGGVLQKVRESLCGGVGTTGRSRGPDRSRHGRVRRSARQVGDRS